MAMMQVPVTKGKGSIEIDTDKIPEDVFREAMLQGLKVLLNRGQSKITKASTKDEAEMKALAMEAAAKQLELVMTSKIKFTGGKAKSTVTGAVKTEAMRIARALVKQAIKDDGQKVSHYDASEITKYAKVVLDEDASIIETAKANLEERAKVPTSKINVKAMAVSPKKVADAEAKKSQLSKTQAGKVAVRAKAKPGQQPTAH